MSEIRRERVIVREFARELTPEELTAVSGGDGPRFSTTDTITATDKVRYDEMDG